jgi:HlyD family secretion protein/epimerase transport system membrane fusion protein
MAMNEKQKSGGRREFWLEHIEACARIGGTIKQYAEEHGLSPGAFYSARRRYAKEGAEAPTRDVEAPVKRAEAPGQDAEAPGQGTGTPVQVAKVPVQGAEAPVKGAEVPGKGAEVPGKGAEAPVQMAKAPVQIAKAPVLEDRGHQIEAPAVPPADTSMPAIASPPKVPSKANPWMTSSPAALLRSPIIAGYVVIILFFGGLGAWSATAHIASAAIATGVISPDGSRKTVQHLEGGIIAEIMVDDGDAVMAGDLLVVLEETQARASFQVLQGQKRLLAAKLARLLSEQAGKNEAEFPDWLLAQQADDPEVAQILDAQRDVFAARNEAYLGRNEIGGKRIAQLEEEILGLQSQVSNQRQQLELIDEEIASMEVLVERGMLARPQYLEMRRRKAEVEGAMAENVADVARAKQSIGETELEIVSLGSVRLDEIVTELAETRSELAVVEERLSAQRDVLNRTVVTAPVSGTIMEKRFHTTGGVVGPGQPILDIVPLDAELLIDARVRPVDIDEVTAGLKARVHFLAYSERNLPQIHGVVRSVSADSLLDEVTGQSYYLARVEVPPDELKKLGDGVKIFPGMTAEVLVMTGERTLLRYLVQPVLDSLRRSFRES